MVRIIFLCLILFAGTTLFAQNDTVPGKPDTLGLSQKDKTDRWADYEHKPKRAALWSLFPGAGQIYNEVGYRRIPHKKHRAWWKAPVIYGGLGVCGYYFWDNYTEGRDLRKEWETREADSTYNSMNPLFPKYYGEEDFELIDKYDFHARRRDIFTFATIGIYAINLIEAYVDAHFVTFDVSEDLGLRVMPVMFDRQTPGLSLRLSFLSQSAYVRKLRPFPQF